ncbi:hypothetical protein F4815DRAFT_348339 [Daldinia loculata]|nr:hypothetical protein F4815DRAFT_348339 [Daldinia loculata]
MKVTIGPATFASIFWLAESVGATLSRIGNITLFSDTLCQEPVYVNSFILGFDTCGKENSATPYLDPFQSYILNERPWCQNGTRPYFNYSDSTCLDLTTSNEPGPFRDENAQPRCIAPGDFKGMAFICDGFDGIEGTADDTPTAKETLIDGPISTTSRTTSIPSNTPISKFSSTQTPSTASFNSIPTSSPILEGPTSNPTVTDKSPSSSSNASSSTSAAPIQTNMAKAITNKGLVVHVVLLISVLRTIL